MAGRCIRFGPNGFELKLGERPPFAALLAVVCRALRWLRAGRLRRAVATVAAILFALIVFPGLVGAVAMASGGGSSGAPSIDGVAWTNIRDTSGVPLSNYMFVTDEGGLLYPENTVLALLLELEAVGYIMIVTFAIWIIGYALSFQWLNWMSDPLIGMAESLTEQFDTPIVLATFATLGAFVVAWFVARGYHAKAALQVATMLTVAILGPLYLAEPLGDVLSSHGLLSQGRDVGISVAAGLNGHDGPRSGSMVPALQSEMADSFARRPLQVWNFGHVVDERAGCRAAWSTGIAAGDDDRVKKGLLGCGDTAAYARADAPSIGQLGTGLLLLLSSLVVLGFGAYSSGKVVICAFDAVMHGFALIFGLCAGGFVYGVTQVAVVRSCVGTLFAVARMIAYTAFVGGYCLFLTELFDQARGREMSVFVLAACVQIIAIVQLRRLSRSLKHGDNWLANRFALAIQGNSPQGGTSGTALGMGTARAGSSMSGLGMIAGMAALNTINTSPLTAWIWGKTKNPLDPYSILNRKSNVNHMLMGASGAPLELQLENQFSRLVVDAKAIRRAHPAGEDLGRLRALQNMIDWYGDHQIPPSMIDGSLGRLGYSPAEIADARAVLSKQRNAVSLNPSEFIPRAKVTAATGVAANLMHGDARMAVQGFAQAEVAAANLAGLVPPPRPVPEGTALEDWIDVDFIERAMSALDPRNPLYDPHNPPLVTDSRFTRPAQWVSASEDTLAELGRRLAVEHRRLAEELARTAEAGYESGLAETNLPEWQRINAENMRALMNSDRQLQAFERRTDQVPNDPWPGNRVRNQGDEPAGRADPAGFL